MGHWLLWLCIAAQLTSWSLILFGTAEPPRYLAEYLASRFTTVEHTRGITRSRLLTSPLSSVSHLTSSNDTAHDNISTAAAADRSVTDSSTESLSTNTGQYNCVSVSMLILNNKQFTCLLCVCLVCKQCSSKSNITEYIACVTRDESGITCGL